MAPVKRKRTNRSLAEKCKTLKDLENGMSNKDVAAKYGDPQNAVSICVKNKLKLTASLKKKRESASQKKYMLSEHEKVDKTICIWFIDKRRQQIPIDGVIIKKKVLEFAKALGVTEFKASNCWLSI